MATIHPYKGYLNTEFHIYAKGTKDVKYEVHPIHNGDDTYIMKGSATPNIPHSIKFKDPGAYKIIFSDGTSTHITIEDGYKFGGGTHKKSFVFDNCPWVFVVMHDRTYFYNRISKEQYVEAISPDTITPICDEYVIFENKGQKEQTVYSLNDQCPILNISDIIYTCQEGVVWYEGQESERFIKTFSFKDKTCCSYPSLMETADMAQNQVVYTSDNKIYRLDCSDNFSLREIATIFGSPLMFTDSQTLLMWNENHVSIYNTSSGSLEGKVEIDGVLSSINGKNIINVWNRYCEINKFSLEGTPFVGSIILCKYNDLNVYRCEWGIYYSLRCTTIEKSEKRTVKNATNIFKSLNSDSCQNLHDTDGKVIITPNRLFFFNDKENLIVNPNWNGIKYSEYEKIFIHDDEVILYKDKNIFLLNKDGYWNRTHLKESVYSFSDYSEFGVIKDETADAYRTARGYKLGKRQSHYIGKWMRFSEAIVLMGGKILWKDIEGTPSFLSESRKLGINVDKSGINLLTLNDNKYVSEPILEDLYDSHSFHNVLFSVDGSQFMYRDTNETKVLDIVTSEVDTYENVSYIKHINGQRPLFRAGALQPRLVDPVTKSILSHNDMTEYQFISPNAIYYADTRLEEYIEYYYADTNEIIAREEYRKLLADFEYPIGIDKESPRYQVIMERRKKFLLRHCDFIQENYPQLVKGNHKSDKWMDSFLDKDITNASHFLSYFISEKGIAVIRKTVDDSEFTRIELGSKLEFLNYVSFSYDSRYVALAGYRGRGLFLLYDLIEKRTIIHKDTHRAVWNTAFSKTGSLAAYTSDPNTLFISDETGYETDSEDIKEIIGRNFLTYSPDGEYFALSSQGYISKYDKDGNIQIGWGHQPSSLVEIRATGNFSKDIISFHDLSEEGIADSSVKRSVASVSFSDGNKRLMMVGKDGVVIIRNLHLDDYAEQ